MKKQFLQTAFQGLALAIIWLSLTAGPTLGQTEVVNQAEDELKALMKRMATAQVKYDSATLDRLFTPDYVEISPIGEVDSREKVLGFYTPEAKSKDGGPEAVVEVSEFRLRVYAEFAIVLERLSFSTTIKGKPPIAPIVLRVTAVCRKENGVWRVASTQYTAIKSH
ncbi:MAG TPA: nuclear transport factor 2 family protein [Pyrinomonadaceae bacterium]|nr:nuclear transport factor 2 family protein [Pyrinomonadaceae bacterium]